jgi:hypothetical protein
MSNSCAVVNTPIGNLPKKDCAFEKEEHNASQRHIRENVMQNDPVLFTEPMPEPPGSIRAKTRDAIRIAVTEGMSLPDAAEREGVAPATLDTALRKPEVQTYITALKQWKDRKDKAGREGYLGEALDEARKLMREAKSEAVRMRAIEFLHLALAPRDTGGRPSPMVNLTQNIGPGYAYSPPPDTTTAQSDLQAIEGKAQSLDDS